MMFSAIHDWKQVSGKDTSTDVLLDTIETASKYAEEINDDQLLRQLQKSKTCTVKNGNDGKYRELSDYGSKPHKYHACNPGFQIKNPNDDIFLCLDGKWFNRSTSKSETSLKCVSAPAYWTIKKDGTKTCMHEDSHSRFYSSCCTKTGAIKMVSTQNNADSYSNSHCRKNQRCTAEMLKNIKTNNTANWKRFMKNVCPLTGLAPQKLCGPHRNVTSVEA